MKQRKRLSEAITYVHTRKMNLPDSNVSCKCSLAVDKKSFKPKSDCDYELIGA